MFVVCVRLCVGRLKRGYPGNRGGVAKKNKETDEIIMEKVERVRVVTRMWVCDVRIVSASLMVIWCNVHDHIFFLGVLGRPLAVCLRRS